LLDNQRSHHLINHKEQVSLKQSQSSIKRLATHQQNTIMYAMLLDSYYICMWYQTYLHILDIRDMLLNYFKDNTIKVF